MSSKSTILLTSHNEHWHQECVEPRDAIVLEIDKSSLMAEPQSDSDGLLIYIKQDSPLGKLLWHPEVVALFDKLTEQQAEEWRRANP